MKANGSTGAGGGEGGGGGGDDDDASSPGKDNQLYGVLEALLDLRCATWTWRMGPSPSAASPVVAGIFTAWPRLFVSFSMGQYGVFL